MRPCIALAIGVAATTARAEPKEAGVDATLVVPLSPWKRDTGSGGGGSLWLHIPISPIVDVTARLGALVHPSRDIDGIPGGSKRLSEVPLVGGARIRLTDGFARAYLDGEVGLVFARTDVEADHMRDSSAVIRLASSLGASVELGRFDIRLSVWFANLSDLDHAIGVTASVGARALRW